MKAQSAFYALFCDHAFSSCSGAFKCFLEMCALWGEGYKLSYYVRYRPEVLDCMPSSGGWKMQHSSACTEMGKGPFWTLNFDLKSSNLGDPNWSERSVWVLWGGVGSFLYLPIDAPLWGVRT